MIMSFFNEESEDQELVSVHIEKSVRYYIFYTDKGKYIDYRVEVYE